MYENIREVAKDMKSNTTERQITFETKCWQGDWEVLLKTNYLERQIKNCNADFAKKRLLINNVDNIDEVKRFADLAVEKRIIDEYVIVDDYAEEALDYFGLRKDDLGIGYYYSIAELVGIYVCDTKYLLHFSSDSYLQKSRNYNFVEDAVQLLNSNYEIAVVNPIWNYKYNEIS